MRVGPVTKTDKRNRARSKRSDDDVMSVNCDVIVFILFMVNFQPSGSRISVAWSIKLRFSLTVPIYLTKTENRTKKSLTQFSANLRGSWHQKV